MATEAKKKTNKRPSPKTYLSAVRRLGSGPPSVRLRVPNSPLSSGGRRGVQCLLTLPLTEGVREERPGVVSFSESNLCRRLTNVDPKQKLKQTCDNS